VISSFSCTHCPSFDGWGRSRRRHYYLRYQRRGISSHHPFESHPARRGAPTTLGRISPSDCGSASVRPGPLRRSPRRAGVLLRLSQCTSPARLPSQAYARCLHRVAADPDRTDNRTHRCRRRSTPAPSARSADRVRFAPSERRCGRDRVRLTEHRRPGRRVQMCGPGPRRRCRSELTKPRRAVDAARLRPLSAGRTGRLERLAAAEKPRLLSHRSGEWFQGGHAHRIRSTSPRGEAALPLVATPPGHDCGSGDAGAGRSRPPPTGPPPET
jgi:hypothetical protein